MRKVLLLRKPLTAAVLATLFCSGVYAEEVTVDTMEVGKDDIVIVFTNDIHGGISGDFDFSGVEDNLGFAGLKAVKDDLLSRTENVTTVDMGDAIQGTAICTESNGKVVMELMDLVGYDIRIPGNHEFDFGMPTFLEYAEDTGSFLSCNFVSTETGRVFDDYRIISYEVDGKEYKIGYVGMCTPETMASSSPAIFQNEEGEFIYQFSAEDDELLYNTVQASIDAALADGADLIIGLGHVGDVGVQENWSSYAIVGNTTGMDAFLDGHAHNTIPGTWIEDKEGNPVLLASTGTKLNTVGVLDISFEDEGEQKVHLASNLVNTLTEEELNSESYLQMQEKVADIEEDYMYLFLPITNIDFSFYDSDPETKERRIRSGETNLGDLLTDAYRSEIGADISMIAGGNIRAGLEEGSVNMINLLTVMPWYEKVVEIEVTGEQILDALEIGAREYPNENGGFLQVSGLTYTIDTSIPSSVVIAYDGTFVGVDGEYRVKDVKIGGEDLAADKHYTAAMNAYTALKGGDRMSMLKECPVLIGEEENMLDHDIVLSYLQKCDKERLSEYQDPYGQGRITILE